MIPRNFFQTFRSSNLPPRLERNAQEHRERNPGWHYQLFDDRQAEDFASSFDHRIGEAYRRINPAYGAARADLLRHLLIYKFGGVYLDIKSELSRPLDEVLKPDDSYILTQWENGKGAVHEGFGMHHDLANVPGGEFQNYHVIAEASHPFTEAAIERIVSNIMAYRPWSAVGRTGVLRTTGPIAYTLAIHPILETAPHRQTTEAEIGASISITDYDHAGTFPNHYSGRSDPVVLLGSGGAALSRAFAKVRKWKASVR